jgi:long-chain acyl-CoA synthetase
MTTADYLLQTSDSERVALIDKGVSYTYGDLRARVEGVARSLAAAGVLPHERVGILGNNSLFWVVSYLAILKLGGVAVPFSPALKPAQLEQMQRLVGCRAVCAQCKELSAGVRAVFADAALVTESALEAGPGAGESLRTSGAFDKDQIAALMFTSGTTAGPRAVCVTYGNIEANTDSIIVGLGIEPEDRMMVVLPFHYCFGTSLLHTHLRAGASLVLASNYTLPEVVLDQIEAAGCTSFAGVPSVYQLLLRGSTFPKRSMPTLRKFQQAGGKLSTVLIGELATLRPEAKIYIMYGQTEATARLSCLPPEFLHSKMGSIGRGLPGVTLSVLGEDGQPIEPGQVGEIVASGANVTAGYLDDPEASARVFAGGVLHTGDMATVDEEGFIYIVDRQNDFIKPLGRRVSSYEIEACLLSLPEVVAAAAVGVPDPLLGEAVKVFVTLRAEGALPAQAIIDHCRRHLPRYMAPREVVIVGELPMNAQGKVLKSALRSLA